MMKNVRLPVVTKTADVDREPPDWCCVGRDDGGSPDERDEPAGRAVGNADNGGTGDNADDAVDGARVGVLTDDVGANDPCEAADGALVGDSGKTIGDGNGDGIGDGDTDVVGQVVWAM
jgi:hypothetical protein